MRRYGLCRSRRIAAPSPPSGEGELLIDRDYRVLCARGAYVPGVHFPVAAAPQFFGQLRADLRVFEDRLVERRIQGAAALLAELVRDLARQAELRGGLADAVGAVVHPVAGIG